MFLSSRFRFRFERKKRKGNNDRLVRVAHSATPRTPDRTRARMSSFACARVQRAFRTRVRFVAARRASRRSVATRCEFDGDDKMYVPPGAFGGTTPERQASRMLSTMMTYIATWIVIDQTETVAPSISMPDGADSDDAPTAADGSTESTRAAARITGTHDFLLGFLERNPCRDGDVFMEALFAANPDVARRVAETRVAYASGDFEWENARRLTLETMRDGNARTQADFLAKTFRNSADFSVAAEGEDDDAAVQDEKREPESRSCRTHAATKTEWRRTRGATRAYRDVFRECSEGFRSRGAWVLKSFDGFIEFGLADAGARRAHLDSINKLGQDLRDAGVDVSSDADVAEKGLLVAIRAELEADVAPDAWTDRERRERWEEVVAAFCRALA